MPNVLKRADRHIEQKPKGGRDFIRGCAVPEDFLCPKLADHRGCPSRTEPRV